MSRKYIDPNTFSKEDRIYFWFKEGPYESDMKYYLMELVTRATLVETGGRKVFARKVAKLIVNRNTSSFLGLPSIDPGKIHNGYLYKDSIELHDTSKKRLDKKLLENILEEVQEGISKALQKT